MRSQAPYLHRQCISLVLILPALAAQAQQLSPELYAGFKAGFTCSAVFHAGRELNQIKQDELGGLGQPDSLPDPVIDRDTKSVSCAYAQDKPPRIAVFIDGLGTVLLAPGATIGNARDLPRAPILAQGDDAAKIPWPMGDLVPDAPAPSELDRAKLDKAVDDAFHGAQYQPHKTVGVVVVYKDRIVAERYAVGWGPHTQYRTWSTAKSITNALIGILVKQGRLRVDQPAPIPEWQAENDPRRAITIEHLLHMSSGLESDGANTIDAYWGGIDTGKDAANKKLEAEPGTRWKYANYDTLLLVRSMREVLPDLQAYLEFPRRELLDRLGMRHTFPETDPYGNFILSSQVYSTPRDLARFGLLYLHDGVWDGQRILPEGWVEYTVSPAPAHTRSGDQHGYGKQFWLMGTDRRLPDDAFSTAGHRGQHATIVPSKHLVVVRMGLDPMTASGWNQAAFVADIIGAIRD